jgi:alanine racemase
LTLSDRTWVEIDLAAIRENARTVLGRAKGARLLPMLKADAYGLGAVEVARALEELDPWGYGVASADEGRELRESGITRAILVVQPTTTMLEQCALLGLTPALGTIEDVGRWLSLTKLPFHVGVDTGMNRGGIWWEEFAREARVFEDAPGFEGLMTHFHSAERDPASVREQWDRFQRARGALGRRPKLLHAANSAAALGHPEVAADLVRPGIFLYGGAAGTLRPKPVVTWRARISRVARREKGASVSYGATWRADAPVWITTVAAGYADGYRRALSNTGEALIGGRRCKVTGTVTMDFTMVRSDTRVGAEQVATLIGTEGSETITLDDVATQAGTISYEILTGLGPRVERVYR